MSDAPTLLQERRRRFTVAEYRQMGNIGILKAEDRVELIEGQIVRMSPIGSPHAACVDRLNQALVAQAAGRAIVRVQNPVRLVEHSEPQPDLALLRRRPDFYAGGHPGPGDVLLLVEVADTSLDYDRRVKLPLYARSGVPECWLVDPAAACVEVYRAPAARGFGEAGRVGRDGVLTCMGLPGLSVKASLILD